MLLEGGGGHRNHGPRRGQDVGHELRVTLEDLYNGKTKKLAIQRQVICKKCAGKGGTGSPVKCAACRGSGVQGNFFTYEFIGKKMILYYFYQGDRKSSLYHISYMMKVYILYKLNWIYLLIQCTVYWL